MIRGAQLSIVRRLDSQHVMTVHTALTTWIAKHIGAYESNNNKGLRNTAVLFFRVLIPLLATVDSRDALRM
jgi:cohesin complex subunit SA-1/2